MIVVVADYIVCWNGALETQGIKAQQIHQAPPKVLRPPPIVSRAAYFGAATPSAKLTEDQVRAIRRSHLRGVPQRQLAKAYGVHVDTIGAICRRETWRHVR